MDDNHFPGDSWSAIVAPVVRPLGSIGFLEDGTDIVQAGNETGAVDFLGTARSVAEADDIGAMLPQAGVEGEAFGVIRQWDEASFAVGVITHEDGKFSCRREGP